MKKILLAIVLALTLTSCGTANLGGKVKKVEIGMTKPELISILGNSYEAQGAVKTPEGTLETLRFSGGVLDYNHIFILLNGKLVEWYPELPPQTQEVIIEHRRTRSTN